MAWTTVSAAALYGLLSAGGTQPTLEDDSAEAGVLSAEDDGGMVEASASIDAQTLSDVETTSDFDNTDSIEDDSGFDSDDTVSADLEPIAAAPASGGIDPFKGRLGVGAIRTIAGLNGINVRYFLTDKFALGGSAGVALFTYREDDPGSTDPMCPDDGCELENTRTVAAMAFNIEGLYFLHLGREAGRLPFRADFGLGGRFGVMATANASDVEDNLDDPLELHIEIPLIFQLMFGNNFALSPELGMDFRIIPGKREDGDANPGTQPGRFAGLGAVDGPGFGWDLTPGIGLFGGASMHYYF